MTPQQQQQDVQDSSTAANTAPVVDLAKEVSQIRVQLLTLSSRLQRVQESLATT